MAGSVLVKDLLYRVCKDLGDINPQFTRWTQKELVNAINDGQRAIAKFLPPACARIDAVRLEPGTRQSIAFIPAARIRPGDGSAAVDVRGNLVQSVSRFMGVAGATPGSAIRIADRDMLDLANPEWHSLTAAKPTDYAFDPRTPQYFYVSPGVPASPAVWVEVAMLADPAEIPNNTSVDYAQGSVSTQTLSIDDKYIDDLMHYVMARGHMKATESQASVQMVSAYSTMFVNSINAQAAAMTGVNPNLKSLPLSPQVPAAAS